MVDVDRLWRDTLRLTVESRDAAVIDLVMQCLEFEVPWTTRLCGVAGVLNHRFGHPVGVTIYASVTVGETIWAVASAGMTGPMAVNWGSPVSGLAAAERTAQFVGDGKAFPDYQGGWLGVTECVAVPVTQEGRIKAVLEVRSHQARKLQIPEAELTGQVAMRLSQMWPAHPDARQ